MIGIYKIENLVNGKVYIGQSKHIKQRFEEHSSRLLKNKHENLYLQRAWNKYGEENFKFEVIEECEEEKLTEREQYWIDYYGGINCDNTYNSKAPDDAVMFSDDVRKRMSDTHKQNPNRYWLGKKRDKETIEKVRKTLLVKNVDRVISEETRQKLSEAGKGRIVSEKTRQKLSFTLKNRVMSEETRKKMSESAKKRKRFPMTEEHRQNLSKSLKGKKKGPMSEDRKQHLKQVLKGRERAEWEKEKISQALKGKPLSEKHKQALKEGWEKRKQNGKCTPWNKGLTKETDERLLKLSKSVKNYFDNQKEEN